MRNVKEKETRTFFNKWAKTYDNFILGWWMRYLQKSVIDGIAVKNGMKLLDVGCGTGHSLLVLSRKNVEGKLVGLDISQEMLQIARIKFKDNRFVELKLADVSKIPYKDNYFDYVISTEAFHHFPDPNGALREISRVLNKRGMLTVVDINVRPLSLSNVLFKVEPGFIKMYSKNEFKRMFEGAGLKVLKQQRIGLFALMSVGQKL